MYLHNARTSDLEHWFGDGSSFSFRDEHCFSPFCQQNLFGITVAMRCKSDRLKDCSKS